MRTIFLYSGEEVLVDDEDFQRVSAHRWYASRSRRAMLPGWFASQTDMLAEDWEIVA